MIDWLIMHDLALSRGAMQRLHSGRPEEESGVKSSQGSVETPGHLGAGPGEEKIAHSPQGIAFGRSRVRSFNGRTRSRLAPRSVRQFGGSHSVEWSIGQFVDLGKGGQGSGRTVEREGRSRAFTPF